MEKKKKKKKKKKKIRQDVQLLTYDTMERQGPRKDYYCPVTSHHGYGFSKCSIAGDSQVTEHQKNIEKHNALKI